MPSLPSAACRQLSGKFEDYRGFEGSSLTFKSHTSPRFAR